MESPVGYFSFLTDPCVERTREHSLEDILFISIASIICGAEGRNEMEEFGRAREDRLKTFLRLPGGIPSHDTFNRVFSALNPEELEGCFMDWTRPVADLCENEVMAIDGKEPQFGQEEHRPHGQRTGGKESYCVGSDKS